MTGFARQESQSSWGSLSCEIRSVNQRYLEPTIRLPEPLRALEPAIRKACRHHLQRGKIEVTLQLVLDDTQDQTMTVNTSVVEQLSKASASIAQTTHHPVAPLDPLQVLQWPGVLTKPAIDSNALATAAQSLFDSTLALLIEHRIREGEALQAHIEQRLEAMDDHLRSVQQQMPEILKAQQQKLSQRLADMAVTIEPERLAQEVAILVNKADIDEELDRLSIHIAEIRHILHQQGAVGRRLDFMMQELNREANTLSSKAIHTDTTQVAVSLKVLIEQMREQIQNIE